MEGFGGRIVHDEEPATSKWRILTYSAGDWLQPETPRRAAAERRRDRPYGLGPGHHR